MTLEAFFFFFLRGFLEGEFFFPLFGPLSLPSLPLRPLQNSNNSSFSSLTFAHHGTKAQPGEHEHVVGLPGVVRDALPLDGGERGSGREDRSAVGPLVGVLCFFFCFKQGIRGS